MIRFYGIVNKESYIDILPGQLLDGIEIPKIEKTDLEPGTYCEVRLTITLQIQEIIHLDVQSIKPDAFLAVRDGNAYTLQKIQENAVAESKNEVNKHLIQDIVDRLTYLGPNFELELRKFLAIHHLDTETDGIYRKIN